MFFPLSLLVQSKSTDPLKSKHQLDLERAHFLVTQAFDEDEKGSVEDAIELYTEAVDLCLKTVGIVNRVTLDGIMLRNCFTYS